MPTKPPVETKTLEEVSHEHIEATLKNCNGNKTHTANALGISRRGLYTWLKRMEKKEKRA